MECPRRLSEIKENSILCQDFSGKCLLPSPWWRTEAASFFSVPLDIQQIHLKEIKSNEPRKELCAVLYFSPLLHSFLEWKIISPHLSSMPLPTSYVLGLPAMANARRGPSISRVQGKGWLRAPAVRSWPGRDNWDGACSSSLPCWTEPWVCGTWGEVSKVSLSPGPTKATLTDTMIYTHSASLVLPVWANLKGEFSQY